MNRVLSSRRIARGCRAACIGWLALAAAGAAQAQFNFEWGRVSPYAVFAEEIGSSRITVEASITNSPPRVAARFNGNWFSGGAEPYQSIQLRDDGTGGDAIAGDGVYTGQFTFTGAVPRLRRYSGQLDHLPIIVQTEDSAGNHVPFANGTSSQLELGLVSGKNRIDPVQLGDRILASDAAVNIVDAGYFSDANERRVMQAFYGVFPDNFDGFAIFSGGRTVADGIPAWFAIRNLVSGTGQPPSDTSAQYGSQGKLKYGIRANKAMNGEEFLHLFGHAFGIYLNQPALDLTANGGQAIHWGPSDIIGQMVGGSYLRHNQDGTFTVTNASPDTTSHAHHRFADLELYLMGFIGPEKVAPHRFAITAPAPNFGSTILADQTRLVRVEDIISAYGARSPAAGDAQKNFTYAFIVVSDAFVSTAELTYINTLARYYASGVAGGTLVAGGLQPAPDPPSFAAATHGLGSLSTTVFRYDQRTYDRLFDWAEAVLPQYFSWHAPTQNILGYTARSYGGEIYLGALNGRIFVYGPPWGGGLRDVGTVMDYLPLAIQAGY